MSHNINPKNLTAYSSMNRSYMRSGFWDLYCDSSDFEKPDLKLYLFYGEKKELNYSPSFDKILTDKKFVTHAINFDINKYTIKPESIGFIQQLADWLKQNHTIKLEIDGHTDSVGIPAAN